MKKHSLVFFLLLFAVGTIFAQNTITGTVLDETGEALIGANVLIKDSTTGTITDIDGKYSLSASPGDILVISYTGYKTLEMTVGSSNVLDIKMSSDAELLGEVVVTALGVERPARELGYAVSTVKGEELTYARDANIVNSLQGKTSGVQITSQSGNLGGSSKILIRGINSLSGGNDPLWIVDGVPILNSNISTGSRITGGFDVGNRAQDINPDDIESITVLKGANAAALYGSRASNGAIIITTKRGQSKDGKASVSINSSVRLDNPLRLPDFQNTFGPGNNGKYDVENGSAGWGPSISGQTVTDFAGDEVALRAFPSNVEDFYETGTTLVNNVSVSNASADGKSDYRFSLTALNQQGIVPASELDRYTISLNAGTKLANKLTSRMGINVIRTTSEGRAAQGANDPNVLTNIINLMPRSTDLSKLDPWINIDNTQNNPLDAFTNNPFWIANENKFNTESDRLYGNFSLEYEPIEWLSILGRLGYDIVTDDRFRSNRVGTVGRETGDFTDDNIQQRQTTFDLIATVQKDLSQDIGLTVRAGYQVNERVFERITNNATGLTIGELFDTGNAENNAPVKDFSRRRLFAFFGEATLSYKGWLSLTGTARNDWSSTLPLDNNSYFYPSVGLSWVFTDAIAEMKNDILTFGKLRASWAEVGGDTGPYQLDFNFSPQADAFGQFGTTLTYPFNGALAFSGPATIPPEGLRPEQNISFEVGAELEFFDGRFNIDFTYYNNETKDQILAITIPESTGFNFRRTNIGQTSNKGVELEVGARILDIGGFKWDIDYNFTKNTFTVDELAEGVDRLVINSGFNSTQVVAEPGEAFGLYGNRFARATDADGEIIDEDQILVDPETGLRFQGDNGRFGNIFPDYLMGLTNSFSYKGLSLRATLDLRKGGVVFSNTVGALRRAGVAEETAIGRDATFIDTDAFIQDADGNVTANNVPVDNVEAFWAAYSNASIAEANVFDGSFLKLREISLSYQLPKTLFTNTPLGGISVGLEARNVAILYSEIPHIDPETNLFGSANDGAGVERGSLPSTRSIGANLRIQF